MHANHFVCPWQALFHSKSAAQCGIARPSAALENWRTCSQATGLDLPSSARSRAGPARADALRAGGLEACCDFRFNRRLLFAGSKRPIASLVALDLAIGPAAQARCGAHGAAMGSRTHSVGLRRPTVHRSEIFSPNAQSSTGRVVLDLGSVVMLFELAASCRELATNFGRALPHGALRLGAPNA